jgi:hypothetical protein
MPTGRFPSWEEVVALKKAAWIDRKISDGSMLLLLLLLALLSMLRFAAAWSLVLAASLLPSLLQS